MKKCIILVLLVATIISGMAVTAFAQNGADYDLMFDDRIPVAGTVTLNENENVISYSDGVLRAIKVGTTTITVDGVEKTVKVSPAKVNIVLIAGQSNAAGVYGRMDGASVVCPDEGYGYIWQNGTFADLHTHVDGLVAAYPERSVGLYAPLAKQWYDQTGEKVIIIHTSSSGKAITTWASYDGVLTNVTTGIVSTVKSCISAVKTNANFELVDVGYYWVQGESDAWYDWNNDDTNYTYATAEQYEAAFTPVHNAFIAALETSGLDAYGGNVCLRSIKCLKSNGQYNEYCGVRVAQQNMVNQLEDFYMATVRTEYWLGENYTSGIIENLHYTQYAYNEIGVDAAKNMIAARDQVAVTDIQLIGQNGVTFYGEDDLIFVEDNMRFIGPYNQSEEGAAQLAARVLPVSAASNGLTMTLTDMDGNLVTGVIEDNGYVADASQITEPLKLVVKSGSVTKTYTLTTKDYVGHYWTFDQSGNATGVTTDGWVENALHSDKGWDNGELTADGALAGSLAMTTPVVLPYDEAWTVEWKGGGSANYNVVLANNDKTADVAAGAKAAEFLYLEKSGTFRLRLVKSGAANNAGMLEGISDEIAKSADTVFYMTSDGNGNLTFIVENGDTVLSKTVTGALTQDYTFNTIKGYYIPSVAATYGNQMEYMKIYPHAYALTVEGELDLDIQAPVTGEVPVTSVTGRNYTGTIVWGGATPSRFAAETAYTASITLTASNGAVFDGATVTGAADTKISADGKNLTASITYPATEKISGYYWDFDGDAYTYVTGNGYGVNELTPNATMTGALDMAEPITLTNKQAWTIEWKGGFSSANTSNLHVVPLAYNNVETDTKNPKAGAFIYICGGFDKVADTNKVCVIEANKGGVHGSSMFDNAIVDNATVVDPNTVWNISYDGYGTMTITVTLGETVQTFTEEVSFTELTFNGIKGFLWTSYAAYADNTMDYMKITFEEERLDDGDINADGKLNILDVNKLFGYVNGKVTLDESVLAAADLNSDGKVNVLDVNRLFKMVNQLI